VNDLGQEQIDFFDKMFDLGDFIQAAGVMVRTRTGEVTLLVHDFRILAKAISPLPAAKDEVMESGETVRHAHWKTRNCAPANATRTWQSTRRCVKPSVNELESSGACVNFSMIMDFWRLRRPSCNPSTGSSSQAVHHASQPAQTRSVPADFLRTVFETVTGWKPGARI